MYKVEDGLEDGIWTFWHKPKTAGLPCCDYIFPTRLKDVYFIFGGCARCCLLSSNSKVPHFCVVGHKKLELTLWSNNRLPGKI